MIIAFSGGRDYTDYSLVLSVIDLLEILNPGFTIRVGCARGLDLMVRQITKTENIYVADWTNLKLGAGGERNRRMLQGGPLTYEKGQNYPIIKADLLIAFPGNNGTADCVKQAKSLNIRVVNIPAKVL